MNWISKLAFAMLIALTAWQAQAQTTTTAPVSTIHSLLNNTCVSVKTGDDGSLPAGQGLVAKDCTGEVGQTFTFSATGNIYIKSPTAGYLCLSNHNQVGDALVMQTCNSFTNQQWWRDGMLLRAVNTPGQPCLTATGTHGRGALKLAACGQANVTAMPDAQTWTMDNVDALWPRSGKTSIVGVNGKCVDIQGAQDTRISNNQSAGIEDCTGAVNEYFQFADNGTINLLGLCLTVGGQGGQVGDPVILSTCRGLMAQQWKLNGGFIRTRPSASSLCLAVRGGTAASGSVLELQNCTYVDYQLWKMPTMTWTSGVPGGWPAYPTPLSEITGADLTPAQMKTVLDWIQSETTLDNTPFCWKQKPYDRGPGIAPSECGPNQTNVGLYCADNCKHGYTFTYVPPLCVGSDAGHWMNKPYTPNTSALGCKSNRVLNDLLCYLKPLPGYTCKLTSCTMNCAAGTHDCGAACANNNGQCAASIADMIISPTMMLASMASGGAAGEAWTAVKTAKAALKLALDKGTDVAQATMTIRNDVTAYMNWSETNLATISTSSVEAAIAARYPRGSYNYRYIAREWAARQMSFYIHDLVVDVTTIVLTSADITGVLSTMDAFAKPACSQHTPMPVF